MLRWYALHSKPCKEDLLWEQLCARNIEAYYPRISVKPVNPRSRKIRPYFPGYLFVHVDFDQIRISALQWIPGAHGVVHFGDEPAYIPDHLVVAIKQRLEKIDVDAKTFFGNLVPGEKIIIGEGPFSGHEALFDTFLSGSERVRVLLNLLKNQQIRVTLPVEQVRPIKQY